MHETLSTMMAGRVVCYFSLALLKKLPGWKQKYRNLGLRVRRLGKYSATCLASISARPLLWRRYICYRARDIFHLYQSKKQPSPYSIKEQGKCRKSAVFMRFLTAFLWFLSEQYYCLNMCIIVQTQAHIFRNDWELELDGLEPLAVRLPLLIDLDFG